MFRSSFNVKYSVSDAKTRIQYVTVAMFLLHWYRHALVFLLRRLRYSMFWGGSEFKYLGSVAKRLMFDCVGNIPYTKLNPKPYW